MEIDISKKYVLQATYYNYNYGSVLQCYATQVYFSRKGIKCYLVKESNTGLKKIYDALNRRIEYFALSIIFPSVKSERKKQLKNSSLSKMRISENSKRKIDVFLEKEIYSIKTTHFILRKMAKSKNCEFCIAGSDQIWNASRVFLDKIYFLTFSPQCKRYAFAPSFGGNQIADFNINRYKKFIQKFNRLSAREESGVKLIEKLTKRKAELLMDPVFLLNVNEWDEFSKRSNINISQKYVFVFFLDNPSALAKKQIKSLILKGYKIYSIAYSYEGMDDDGCLLLEGGPEEFVDLIKNASIILTDSFHVTAFSVLFHKDFYVFERTYTGMNQSSRIIDLLRNMNLLYRYNFEGIMGRELTIIEKQRIELLLEENLNKVNLFFD